MNTDNRVKTPVDSEKEIIRLRKAGKTRPEIVVALNKGGFKTALGREWTKTNVGNQVLRLHGRGLIDLCERNGTVKTTKKPAVKAPKRVALKSKAEANVSYVTFAVRVPITFDLGKAVLNVLSLDKLVPVGK